ncbi:MBL fold metallo-hydrolase [Cupriavidus metallidurans]|uniref:MBL fold metallo-hydrolase n=1 Tax=Cupriavidus metallidurans TaxID=119219 RepID=UPI000CE02511|nr:MBL fold metallo-hydrolase [Cupriavidus metallidurans]AVA35863.1 MBL fold metallo-hydrolase [Cupriavidus metallidurans]
MQPCVEPFFDPESGTFSYVVYEADGSECAIIDSVLGYDPRSGRTSTTGAERIIEFVRGHQLTVQWLLETHVHADHLSAAAFLRRQLGGKVGISARIGEVQRAFGHAFNLEPNLRLDGTQFDHLFAEDASFFIGTLPARVIPVPGHTPADVAYQVGADTVFVGDTIFMPDVGTARCDFPGGDAASLFRSIRRLLDLPAETSLYLCHDYPPSHRQPRCKSSVGEQRLSNIHIRDGIGESDFIKMRTTRDAVLALPLLIVPSIQVNVRAGELPAAESNGVRYLKVPIDVF